MYAAPQRVEAMIGQHDELVCRCKLRLNFAEHAICLAIDPGDGAARQFAGFCVERMLRVAPSPKHMAYAIGLHEYLDDDGAVAPFERFAQHRLTFRPRSFPHVQPSLLAHVT